MSTENSLQFKPAYKLMYQSKCLCVIHRTPVRIEILTGTPYGLYLEPDNPDMDVDNLLNFYDWCAHRVLTLDRIHAKEILNACGLIQPETTKEKALIALSYHCLSLKDSYWVQGIDEDLDWDKINLFHNSLNDAVDISLMGKALTLNNISMIAPDCSTDGVAPKAWIREEADGLYLHKADIPGTNSSEREYVASNILNKLGFDVLHYDLYLRDGIHITRSKCYTTPDMGQVSLSDIINMDGFPAVDEYRWDMMNLADYLIGNTDRHWGNIQFQLIDGKVGELLPLMDFNHAFEAILEAKCLPEFYRTKTMRSQSEVAVDIVKKYNIDLDKMRQNIDITMSYSNYICARIDTLQTEMEKKYEPDR